MSRNWAREIDEVAEALRRPTAVGIAGRGPLESQPVRAIGSGSLAPTAVTWAFREPPAHDFDARPTDVPAHPKVTALRTSSLVDPDTISREEATALARRLYELGTAETRRRAVLFSTVGLEGRSARLSAAVADVLAGQTGASVCLVDGNLRSPTLHELFGLPVRRGLSEVLLEADDIRRAPARVAANLWLLSGGSRGGDALQCLSAAQVRPRFQELRAMFDYLVVDTAAANVHSDAVVLGPLVDGVVLVVAANGTRRETARRTVERLQSAGSTVLGAVLADRTFPIPEIIYRKL